MKNIFFVFFIIFLLSYPVCRAQAQTTSSSSSTTVFDTTDFPQWAKDMRRWDIVAFGSFPFALFVSTFFTDVSRWGKANNFDFSEEGRRYAPWPLKSSGAVERTKEEFGRALLIAGGIAASVAFTDLLIVKLKQRNARKRAESTTRGSVNINIIPYEDAEE